MDLKSKMKHYQIKMILNTEFISKYEPIFTS
jgi:hypothetical protein